MRCCVLLRSKAKKRSTQKLVRAAVAVSLTHSYPLSGMCTLYSLLCGFGFMLSSSILVSLQSTLLAYPRAPLSSRRLCMSKRCQPEVRGPSCPFESISRRPGGGGAQDHSATSLNAQRHQRHQRGRAPQRSQRPLLIGVSASRFWSAGSGVGRNCLAYTASLRENWALPDGGMGEQCILRENAIPKYRQYGEFFREIEEYACASVFCET